MPADFQSPTYDNYTTWWQQHSYAAIQAYKTNNKSFIAGLLPEIALKLQGVELLEILYARLGGQVLQQALDPDKMVASPVANHSSGDWLKHSRTVGVNVRTIGNFFNVIKYALTLPAHIDCIHLLPIWEAGVVGSLYGMASRELNPEFFSKELALQFPQLNTVETQLKVVINLLHAMGKKVGMDVIPHTDRYSEIVLANPAFFEWLHRDGLQITDHSSKVATQAELAILGWLRIRGPYQGDLSNIWPLLSQERFFRELDEASRLAVLFGPKADHWARQQRRIDLVDHLYRLGLEPVPATMAPPYRGLEVDPDPAALTIDDAGREWRDYRITHPQEMSRVFGPLTRYQLYEREDDNVNWVIDFQKPRPMVWNYVCQFYADYQATYNFDFMRGDMSHVQMRIGGVPANPDPQYYDLLASVKQHIQKKVPYFAYFAESFLAPDNYMAYGNEVQHLEASKAEVTLGNLQSYAPNDPHFHTNLRAYLDFQTSSKVAPAFTIITADKDDPRFDKFYRHGNVARMFFGLFMPMLPAYYGLGFEQRNIHPYPAPNEYYTKLYVFQLSEGPKATHGPYTWGKNTQHFFLLDRLHQYAEQMLPELVNEQLNWVLYPDATGQRPYFAWQWGKYVFILNFGTESVGRLQLKGINTRNYQLIFQSHPQQIPPVIEVAGEGIAIQHIGAGVGVVIEAID